MAYGWSCWWASARITLRAQERKGPIEAIGTVATARPATQRGEKEESARGFGFSDLR